jgi:hypothetical protein
MLNFKFLEVLNLPLYLSLIVYAIFIIYIVISIGYFRKTRRASNSILTFMTSFSILFTCTVLISTDLINSGNKKIIGTGNDIRNKSAWVSSENPETKISAYFTNTNPPRGSVTYLNVTGPTGGKVTAICQYKGHGTPYIMNIGQNGQAAIPIRVESDAEKGFMVVVDVIIQHEGRTYRTNAVFTPM